MGFFEVEGMEDVFFHVGELPIMGNGFRAVLAGKKAEFDVVTSTDGKLQAQNIHLLEGTGVTHVDWPPTRVLDFGTQKGFVSLRVDALGRLVTTNGRAIAANVVADGYVRAYYTGIHNPRDFKGFSLKIPKPTSSRTVVVADMDKEPRSVQRTCYDKVLPGSYIVTVDSAGKAVVYTVGIRHQSITGAAKEDPKRQTWVVLHVRYRQGFDLKKGITDEVIKSQILTSGKLERDNDGFARAIATAFQRMADAIRTQAPVKV